MSSETLLANEYRNYLKKTSFQELNHESIISKAQCLSGIFNHYKQWRQKLVTQGRVTDKEFEKSSLKKSTIIIHHR